MISFDDAWGKKVRRGEMGTGDIEEAVAGLLAMGVEWTPTIPLLERAARMAVDIEHPVYDCVYLALCADRGAALATADARLRDAARDIHVKLWGRDG